MSTTIIIVISAVCLVTAVVVTFLITAVGPNETAVKTLFGRPYRVVGPGPRLTFASIIDLVKFTTGREEFEFNTEVLTKRDRRHAAVNLTVHLSFRFRWPQGNTLLQAVREFASFNREYMQTIFYEIAVDIAEDICGGMNWEVLFNDRQAFNDAAEQALQNLEAANIVRRGGLLDTRIMLTNVELPEDLKKAITGTEVARLEAEAAATRTERAGRAQAARIQAEYTAIAGENYQDQHGPELRKVEALEKLAQGPGNVVVSLPEISEALSGGAGRRLLGLLRGGGRNQENADNIQERRRDDD